MEPYFGGFGGGYGGGYGGGFGGMPNPYAGGYGRPPQQPPMQYGGGGFGGRRGGFGGGYGGGFGGMPNPYAGGYGGGFGGGYGGGFGGMPNPYAGGYGGGYGGGFGGGYGSGFGGGYGSGFGGMPQPMPQIGYGDGYGRPPQQPPMQYGGDFNRQEPTWTDPHSRLVAAPQLQDPAYVKAVQQVIASNLNDPRETSPFRQAQQQEASKTDYQRLMDQQRMAGMPVISPLGGIRSNILAPDDLQIANSLGFKDPYAARDMLTWAKLPNDPEEMRIKQERQAKAKEYLNSIGYGQSGFDSSKYEVKREPIVRSGPAGLAGLFAGRSSSLV